jgi:hypothetical protein
LERCGKDNPIVGKRGEVLFRERQRFHLGAARFSLAIPPLALLGITLRQIVWHHPWGNPPVTDGGLIFLTILIFLVYIRLLTVRLATELRPGQLSVAMRGLWRRTRVPVTNIRSAKAVQFDPVAEYGGYGIRSGPRGRAFIAQGNEAVQLELGDGGKILVGSQRPEELAQMIMRVQRRL